MTERRLFRIVKRFLPHLALCLALSGCYKWHPIEPPLKGALSYSKQFRVRLTLVDGDSVDMYHPTVRGNTIVGYSEEEHSDSADVSVLLADVTQARGRTVNSEGTVGVVFLTIVGIAAIAFVAVVISVSNDPDY
jgi:hypothetical protein